jgi:uncharacterized protein
MGLFVSPHALPDHIFFVVLVVLSPLVDLWTYPRLKRAVAAGDTRARLRFYLIGIVTLWTLTACVIAIWVWQARPWPALGLGAGKPVGMAITLALALIYVGLAVTQRRALLKRPERFAKLREKLAYGEALLPHTPAEHARFMLLAITAGTCEEFLFRGFLMWYLGVWLGLIPAVLISSFLFGCAHLYLGVPHVWKTSITGLVLALFVVGAGALWPAMIVHAALDLLSGDIGFHIFSQPAPPPAATQTPA